MVKEIFVNFIKGFIAFWTIVITPVIVGILLTVYIDIPWIVLPTAYGLIGLVLALVKCRKSKIEVTSDLNIITTKPLKTHPELLKFTIIINVLFAIQAIGMWLIFVK